MAEEQDLIPHDLNLAAVTAIIRYEAPDTARWPQDKEWVCLNYIYNTKKRFHRNYTFETFQQIIEQEKDRGQPRFRVFTDSDGTVWIKSVSRNNRRANRQAR